IVGGDDQYLRTRPESGETFTDEGLLLPSTATPPNQSAQCVSLTPTAPVVIGSAYLNSFASAPADGVARTQLVLASDTRCVYVAPENGDEMTIRTASTLFAAAALASDAAGFDIAGGQNGLSLAALHLSGTQSTLIRINPANGAPTTLGLIGPSGTPVVDALAVRLVPFGQ
ncbi:MAG TPA: DUF4394 domain-containing protein, partial [Nevskiaceae bacterium]|nr:DUF4394 domain-containing protein [Nevskiaceae bacterium]